MADQGYKSLSNEILHKFGTHPDFERSVFSIALGILKVKHPELIEGIEDKWRKVLING